MHAYKPTRREFFRSASLAAAALTAPAVLRGRSAAAATPLVVTDPGGEWEAAAKAGFYTPYEQESGTKIRFGSRPSLALGQLKAMVEAGNMQWDVTELADYLMYSGGKAGLLEKIDYQGMDTSGMLKDALMPYGVAVDAYATIMAYNTKKWPAGQGPKSWADFWDVKRFPGRRAMSGIGYGPLEFALLADGVAPEAIYPLDIKRALAKMNEIKPHIYVWWTTGAQQAQLMHDDQVDLIQGWNGRLTSGIAQGAPFVLQWNQGMYQWEGWVIPKGSPHPAEGLKFIAYTMRAKQQAIFAEHIAYGPSNQDAFAFIPQQRKAILPTYAENLKGLFRGDAAWLSEHLQEITAAWTQWRAG